jgi:hypothetical protein
MHQTTVRFGPDLWEEISVEARRAGVSVAQYVRDAALMRVSYTRGREGDPHYETAREIVTGASTGDRLSLVPEGTDASDESQASGEGD